MSTPILYHYAIPQLRLYHARRTIKRHRNYSRRSHVVLIHCVHSVQLGQFILKSVAHQIHASTHLRTIFHEDGQRGMLILNENAARTPVANACIHLLLSCIGTTTGLIVLHLRASNVRIWYNCPIAPFHPRGWEDRIKHGNTGAGGEEGSYLGF